MKLLNIHSFNQRVCLLILMTNYLRCLIILKKPVVVLWEQTVWILSRNSNFEIHLGLSIVMTQLTFISGYARWLERATWRLWKRQRSLTCSCVSVHCSTIKSVHFLFIDNEIGMIQLSGKCHQENNICFDYVNLYPFAIPLKINLTCVRYDVCWKKNQQMYRLV